MYYKLLDFGNARRLEQFADLVLDRPAPAAHGFVPQNPKLWHSADARFVLAPGKNETRGEWTLLSKKGESLLPSWVMPLFDTPIRLELKGTPFGHIGVFPDHAECWSRVVGFLKKREKTRLLNLFAYTGAVSLLAASQGAEVTHLDGAGNVVQWARRNAELSSLNEASIRWIAEDARKYVRRELKRGKRYDAILLDPPSYGHGHHGEIWRLSQHLEPLLADCIQLLSQEGPNLLFLSCHSPDYDSARLVRILNSMTRPHRVEPLEVAIHSENGDALPCGSAVQAEW